MLRSGNKCRLIALPLFSLLMAACQPIHATCTGTSQEFEYTQAGMVQYGNVTCVTSPLDKEATYGGE